MRKALMGLVLVALITGVATPASAETIPIEQLVHLKILEGRELGFIRSNTQISSSRSFICLPHRIPRTLWSLKFRR